MPDKDPEILYLGPVKVEIETRFVKGILVLVKKGTMNIIGYPSFVGGICFVQFNINHLNPNIQSAFRRPENLMKWSALMYTSDRFWEGDMSYNWALNDVMCHLHRLDTEKRSTVAVKNYLLRRIQSLSVR